KDAVDQPVDNRAGIGKVFFPDQCGSLARREVLVKKLHDIVQKIPEYARIQFVLHLPRLLYFRHMSEIKLQATLDVAVQRRRRHAPETMRTPFVELLQELQYLP